ncbi:MAG TPA: PAS domain-containing protein, partial [Acidocella sp.]|nr:PAS domain-containing protein [Acidocella sp.]
MRLDLFPTAALLADQNGVIWRANAQAAEMFGFTVDEMAGLPVERLLPASVRNGHDAKIRDWFASPTKARTMGLSQEFSVCRKDNTTFKADISLSV